MIENEISFISNNYSKFIREFDYYSFVKTYWNSINKSSNKSVDGIVMSGMFRYEPINPRPVFSQVFQFFKCLFTMSR